MSDPAPRAPMTFVSGAVVKRHMEAALPVSTAFIQGPALAVKPYEAAIAAALALQYLCESFGWEPQHFHDLIKTVRDSGNLPGGKA